MQWLMKNRWPDRYRDKIEQELTGRDGEPISMSMKPVQVIIRDAGTSPERSWEMVDYADIDKSRQSCQTQALERTQPVLPMKPGYPERQSHDYYRHGVVSLFSAYKVASGRIIGKCHSRHREEEFLKFMQLIETKFPGSAPIHLVLDNLATHKTPRVRNWFARRPRYVLHFTPTGSSWINQVERWFAKITTQAIRRGSFRSVKQLIQAIDDYIVEHNQDPKPFQWTATAESIFAKLEAGLI
jgi:transposase